MTTIETSRDVIEVVAVASASGVTFVISRAASNMPNTPRHGLPAEADEDTFDAWLLDQQYESLAASFTDDEQEVRAALAAHTAAVWAAEPE